MKRALCVMLTLCLLFVSVPYAIASEVIAVDADWTILAPENPTPAEDYAANLLRDNLAQVFGAAPEIVTTPQAPYVAVGSASQADVSGIAANGYRIQAIGGNVHVAGTGTRGLQCGVCRFLEEFCGRKYYAKDCVVLPQADSIAVPADADVVYEPFFEYTDEDWSSSREPDYSLANGLTGGAYRDLPAAMGGAVEYIGGFCHTIGGLCRTADYAESHPEYLALHDGERTADQPCLTNPDVLEIAKASVMEILRTRHDPNASLQIVSVTQNDNQNFCECDACKSFEAAHGGAHAATMLYFVNQIADAVKAAGYDNVGIDTFAYQYTRQAPTGIVPRDNVIVRLCTIECCFAHALDDPDCERNTALMQDLRDWAKICDRLYVWDYVTNYAHTVCVFPDFGVLQRNIQVFWENNVKGIYEEGNYYIWECDGELGELRGYLLAKCLQDPYCDYDAEMNGFLENYYGPGWAHIRRALDLYTDNAGDRNGHLGIYYGAKDSLHLNKKQIAEIDGCWAEAKAMAANETQLSRLTRSELSWRWWKANVRAGEFSILNPGRFDENEKFRDDLIAHGIKVLGEGEKGDFMDCASIRNTPPDEWNMYEAEETGTKVRNFFYRILEKLTPVLTMFGLYYKIAQSTRGTIS